MVNTFEPVFDTVAYIVVRKLRFWLADFENANYRYINNFQLLPHFFLYLLTHDSVIFNA